MSAAFLPRQAKTLPLISHAKGIYVYDIKGKEYLDASSQCMVCNVGYGVEEIIEAANKQMKKVAFAHRGFFSSQPLEELAQVLIERAPGMEQAYLVNSGSEANEAALRFVHQYWRNLGKSSKRQILCRDIGYHGITLGALSLSRHYQRRLPYLTMLPPQPNVSAAYCYRCPFNKEPRTCHLECAQAIEQKILQEGPENIAALIIEPITGAAGGALVPHDLYLKKVREICDKYDILLIFDEILTGLGRTGKWFAHQHWGITPDIISIGKGLGAGYTSIAGLLLSNKITSCCVEDNIFGHTYGSNPLSAATALAAVQYIENNKLIENTQLRGKALEKSLKELSQNYAFIGDVRGKGLLWGIEIVKDKASRTSFDPKEKMTARCIEWALEQGLIVYPCSGFEKGDAFLIAPPLIVNEQHINELILKLKKVFDKVKEALK